MNVLVSSHWSLMLRSWLWILGFCDSGQQSRRDWAICTTSSTFMFPSGSILQIFCRLHKSRSLGVRAGRVGGRIGNRDHAALAPCAESQNGRGQGEIGTGELSDRHTDPSSPCSPFPAVGAQINFLNSGSVFWPGEGGHQPSCTLSPQKKICR